MKGFLNKVAGSNKPAGKADGDIPVAAPTPAAPMASVQTAIRSDATPRADISLPKGRERR